MNLGGFLFIKNKHNCPLQSEKLATLNSSQVPALVGIKITIFWDVARYRLIISAYISKEPNVSIFLEKFPKYGGRTFLRNGGTHLPKLHRTTPRKGA
jgi:hypothetical protein